MIPSIVQKRAFASMVVNTPLSIPDKSTILDVTPSKFEEFPLAKICSDPLRSFEMLSNRLKTLGFTAPFPEFASVVQYLEKEIDTYEVLDFLKNNKYAEMQHKLVKMELLSLKYKFKVENKDYPHRTNYGPYPYMPTINAIRRALEFIDTFVRCTYKDVSGLYHADRYIYHYNHVYDSNFVYFPLIEELTSRDFILTRSIPIGFLGVSAKPIFADGYYNSPLDFFIHDVNHVRRLRSYNDLFKKKNQIQDKEMFEEFHRFVINEIWPHIQIKNNMTEEEKSIRQILELFYFELIHEYALTSDVESFKSALMFKSGDPSPFEHMIESTFKPDNLESIRLLNNNLISGYSSWKPQEEVPTIRYFFDKGPNFLTSAYNKCINGFYDNHYVRGGHLPSYCKRTPELFFQAAKQLLNVHHLNEMISDDRLMQLFKIEGPIEKYPNQDLIVPILKKGGLLNEDQ
ncbi:MAG TPA: hypothetical protein PLC42_04555 [Parachlamydiaceae bacterium]|nr:hypothetical protein [Parachlamydiaceae bacterium]